ncbi:MAG: MMPL family transporter [Deltaproteobacteria bacterium]|nr:MMPL family transporter [Deltaproteobacteria bacterium]
MQERLLAFLFDLGRRKGRIVVACAALATLAGALSAASGRISTSQRDLVPAKHPVQRAYRAFVEDFGAADSLIVVLHGVRHGNPVVLQQAADALAERLRRETKAIASVFYKVDLALMRDRAPMFAPLPVLERAAAALAGQRVLLERAGRVHNLPDLLAAMEEGFARPELAADPAAAALLFDGVGRFFDEWGFHLGDSKRRLPGIDEAMAVAAGDQQSVVRAGGYLMSRDQQLLFMFVQPASSSDDATFLRPLVSTVRRAFSEVMSARPPFAGRVTLALTGLPAHVLTEAETVFSDVGHGALWSVLLVVIIVLVGFRTWRKVLMAVIPMICGMTVGLGLVMLVLGRLNLISAAFMAVMFGMSIDFGIYLVRRVEEELAAGADRASAVRTAMVQTGKGVLTGGLTACAAFAAITLSDFAGFAELGVTAGIGVLACLVSVFVLFPVLALRIRLEPRRPNLARVTERADRPWARRAMAASAVVVGGLAVWAAVVAPRIPFEYDALTLLPRDTESTRYQLRMQLESDFQVSTAMVVASSLPELRGIVSRLRAVPEVARVEYLGDLLPEDQQRKAEVLRHLAPLGELRLDYWPTALDAVALGAQLARLANRCGDAEEAAFAAGKSEMVMGLSRVRERINMLRARLGQMPVPAAMGSTRRFEEALFALGQQGLLLARTWLAARPLAESDLGPELLARFKSKGGRYVAYVTPRGSIWDVDSLDRFVGQLKRVTSRVTGFPITHQVYSRMVVRGFVQAMLYAFVAVVVLLLLDFRRVRPVLLALLPLGLGFLLLQLVVHLAGVDYNYANIAAFPVLLGYGVAYGVNMVQRWMEDPGQTAFVAAATVGKGVLLSAATTLAGLGSIVLARHRGVSTFGFLLLVSIGLCLLAATLVLPVVIDLLYRRR